MSDHGLTPEELAMLTPAERAGLEGGDDGDDSEEVIEGEAESAEAKAAKEGEEEIDPPAVTTDKPAGEDQAAGTETPAGEEGDDKNEQEQAKSAQPVPLFKADVPADIDAKFQDIDTREEALIEKFEDGDLTTREYNAEMRKLHKERSDLEWVQRKAELTQESTQSQREQTWYNELNAFLPEHPAISKNETTWNSFDAVLRRVTAATMEAGGFPGRADIEKAYKQWAEDLGIATDAPAPAAEKKDAPAPAAKKGLSVPPTLGRVPAASQEDTDDGKYAHLDRLADEDPLEYEKAIQKLSPTEWEEYANSR